MFSGIRKGIRKKLSDWRQGKEEREALENVYKRSIAQMAEEGNYDGIKVMYATRNIEEGLARDLGLTSEEDGRYVLGKANNIGTALVKAEESNYSEKSLDQLLGVGCSYGVVALGVAKKAGFIDDDSKAADILYNIGKKAYAGEVGEEKKEEKPKKGEGPDLDSTIELYKKGGADELDKLCSRKELTEYGVEGDVYGGIEDTEKYKRENVVLEPEHSKQEYNVEKIGFLKGKDDGKIDFKPLEEKYTDPSTKARGEEKPEEDYRLSEENIKEGLKGYLETAKYPDTGEKIFGDVEEEEPLLKAVVESRNREMINVEYDTEKPMTYVRKQGGSPRKIPRYVVGIKDIEWIAS